MLTIDHGPINTEEMNRKLTSIQDEVDSFSHISKVSVKSSQEAQETFNIQSIMLSAAHETERLFSVCSY